MKYLKPRTLQENQNGILSVLEKKTQQQQKREFITQWRRKAIEDYAEWLKCWISFYFSWDYFQVWSDN